MAVEHPSTATLHPAEAAGLFLVASAFFLLPFGRAIEIPLAVLVLAVLRLVHRQRVGDISPSR